MLFPFLSLAQELESEPRTPQTNLKSISFHNLTVDDGLSQNSVVSIAQDSIGFLWFATQDGLNKYDGKSFKYYNKQFEDVTKVNFSKLGKIYVDKQNSIWIITNSGKLEKFRPSNDDFHSVNNIKNVSTIYQDNSKNYFIGTYNGSIYGITKKDTLKILSTKDSNITTYSFLEHRDTIYASAFNAIFKISKGDFRYSKITSTNNAAINYSTLNKSYDDTIWIGSYGYGLFYLNGNTLEPFNGFKNNPLPNDLNIEATLFDKHQRLWIATYGKGIYVIDFTNETIDNYTVQNNNPYALHYNDVLCLFQDYTGNIWAGTDGGGLSYYDEHLLKFNVLTNNQLPRGVNVDVARAITSNPKNNNLWIGTSGKGLTTIDIQKKIYKTFTTTNSNLSSNRVMGLKYINEDLWIGYQDMGLDILEPNGNIQHYNFNTDTKLNTNAVWCIYQDSNNNIWLGTGGSGLIGFDKNEGIQESYTHNSNNNASLTSNNIRVITEGKNKLWIGTEDQGLCVLDKDTKTIFRINNVPKKIKSLFFDESSQILWIGTNGEGLIRFNTLNQEAKRYTTNDGLPNNVIYGILPDENNNLWLSSNRGITMFNDKDSMPLIINYDKYDGLQTFEFNTGAYFKAPNNTLYFGGLKGINWFKPEQLSLNQVKPKTIITQLKIFNNPSKLLPNKKFNYKQNTISLEFASLHYSQPSLNNYKYMLINHDLDWIDAGNSNIANYSNLSPNTYTFKVISSNYDGIWNEEPATYTFTIKQAWYKTNLAFITYFILTLTIVWYIYNYFIWRWRMKTQLKLEHSETLRLKKLDAFKTKLFTNISHEFRTPLTLILGPAESQLANPKLSNDEKEELTLISNNAKRLLNLVDQLIDLAKLESGHQKLKIECGNLSILINQLVSSFKYQIEQKKITLNTKISNIDNAWYDRDVVEKIITNLMANAVKYTPKKGYINFKATQQGDHLVVTILNNGCTINPKDINQLFNQFYQANPNADGVGIGLALVKELVTLTKGQLIANLVNSDELQFTVTMPLSKRSFNQAEIIENKENENNGHKLSLNEDTGYGAIQETDKPLVLIVEDNVQLRQYIKSILKQDYKVILAVNGKIGIKKALNKIPDLIISDIMMPETDGIELCNILKNNTLTSHVPIILLTAKTGEQNELEGLEVGADDFITKPFNSKILLKRIENFINLSKSLQKRYTQFSVLTAKDIAISNLDETFLMEVETVLSDHLSKSDFTAQEFSKHMAMSRMQLHRKLMALTGLSTSQFIRSQRLKVAVQLLQESDLSVSEVAYQVGFNSVSYFIKCFKETYNNTPNSYIQN